MTQARLAHNTILITNELGILLSCTMISLVDPHLKLIHTTTDITGSKSIIASIDPQ